jgi:two-component system cit operon sensor histidine kinase CitA
VDNAVDATLKTPARTAPVEVYIGSDELVIEVADRGCGVDEAMKPHIFEQGFTSKPTDSSELTGSEHGIGLYLVAGYVRRAGGSIEISDNIPQGYRIFGFHPVQISLSTGPSHD